MKFHNRTDISMYTYDKLFVTNFCDEFFRILIFLKIIFWPLVFEPLHALGSEYLRSCFLELLMKHSYFTCFNDNKIEANMFQNLTQLEPIDRVNQKYKSLTECCFRNDFNPLWNSEVVQPFLLFSCCPQLWHWLSASQGAHLFMSTEIIGRKSITGTKQSWVHTYYLNLYWVMVNIMLRI